MRARAADKSPIVIVLLRWRHVGDVDGVDGLFNGLVKFQPHSTRLAAQEKCQVKNRSHFDKVD